MMVAHVKHGETAGEDGCDEVEDNGEDVGGTGDWPSTMVDGYSWGVWICC